MKESDVNSKIVLLLCLGVRKDQGEETPCICALNGGNPTIRRGEDRKALIAGVEGVLQLM